MYKINDLDIKNVLNIYMMQFMSKYSEYCKLYVNDDIKL